MKILHYTLGLPPSRSGGLVEYVHDLAEAQTKIGNQVILLYPGMIRPFHKNMDIVRDYNKNMSGIDLYSLNNCFPLPLFNGIKNPRDFMKKTSATPFHDFLSKVNPDVIHIHTFMGMPIEFLEAAKKLNIFLVYTTHDYFGLAPEPNFFFDGKSYDDANSVINWINASKNSLPTWKLKLFQSKSYPYIRTLFRRVHVSRGKNKSKKNMAIDINTIEMYKELKKYYRRMFQLIDVFHFNSKEAEEVYRNNLGKNIKGKVENITVDLDSDIIFHDSNNIRIGYIGPNKEYKGFKDFIKIVNQLRSYNGLNYEFLTYGYFPTKEYDGISQRGKFDSKNLNKVFSNIDILIVPSKWKETFGLVVVEALYFNTEVFVSNNVGAKDLLPDYFVYESIEELLNKIISRARIKNGVVRYKSMIKHAKEIQEMYR